MLKKLFGFLFNHVLSNVGIYSLCVLFLIIGTAVGAVYGLRFENNGYFADFFSNLTTYSPSEYVKECLVSSFLSALIIFVCGVSPPGIVVVPLLIGYKGFVTGYTVSAFFSVYGFKTFAFVILGILPSAFFWLPAYLFGCVNSIRSSCYFLKILRRKPVNDAGGKITELGISSVMLFLGVIISKLIEIFIIPEMLNLVGGIYV